MLSPTYKFILSLPVLLLASLLCFGQTDVVDGVVLDQSGAIRVGSVQIVNSKTGSKATSNDLGLFRISARIADTLRFSRTGYSDQLLVVKSMSDIVVRMQRQIELGEVQVLGRSSKQELDEVREQYRKKGTYYAGKPPVLAYIFTPLTALYELVGKTPNQARRFNAFYTRELQQVEIDRRFNAEKIRSLTGLTGDDLKNFIFMYRPGFDAIEEMDEYALTVYIKKSLENFNNTGRPRGLLSLPALPKAKDLTEKVKF